MTRDQKLEAMARAWCEFNGADTIWPETTARRTGAHGAQNRGAWKNERSGDEVMAFLGWLFGSSAAEVRAAQDRMQAAAVTDNLYRLESQRHWMMIRAQINEGWRPYSTQSTEYVYYQASIQGIGTIGDNPYVHEKIELCRLGEKETWVTRWQDMSPQMNVVDLWWRPWSGDPPSVEPIDGGELRTEDAPPALPPPETKGDAT